MVAALSREMPIEIDFVCVFTYFRIVLIEIYTQLIGIVMDKDDLWIVEHFSELVTKYAGKHIAVVNQKLVAVGESGPEVEAEARKIYPRKIPSVLRIPREEDMACLL
jgi:hypothetical protein